MFKTLTDRCSETQLTMSENPSANLFILKDCRFSKEVGANYSILIVVKTWSILIAWASNDKPSAVHKAV